MDYDTLQYFGDEKPHVVNHHQLARSHWKSHQSETQNFNNIPLFTYGFVWK